MSNVNFDVIRHRGHRGHAGLFSGELPFGSHSSRHGHLRQRDYAMGSQTECDRQRRRAGRLSILFHSATLPRKSIMRTR